MENSWLSRLLPKDEYKEKKMVYFFAESAVIFIFILTITSLISTGIRNPSFSVGNLSFISLSFFLVYILLRYTMSGIEHTDIVSERDYKKEKRSILLKNIFILIALFIVYSLLNGFPSNFEGAVYLLIPCLLIALLMYLIEYISLKKSYAKNKFLND